MKITTLDEVENLESEKQTFDSYNYQPLLTPQLDNLNGNFDQNTINEIELWKVNRYAQLDKGTINLLNPIDKNQQTSDLSIDQPLLRNLLKTKGVGLPMASTILRFKNPSVYQIIDQRVYRLLYGKELKIPSNIDKQIELYFKYLELLKSKCTQYNIDFSNSDRDLYQLDKKLNSEIKLRN